MKNIIRILKNSLYLLFAEFINKFVFYLFSIYVARIFGNELFGKFNSILAYIMVFSVLTDFGLNNYLIRELASKRIKLINKFYSYISFKNIIILISLFFLFSINLIFKIYSDYSMILVLVFYLVFNSYNTFIKSIFRSKEKMHLETQMKFVEGVSLIILSLLLILIFNNFYISLLSFPISSLISFIIFSKKLPRKVFVFIGSKSKNKNFKEVYKDVYPFGFSALFVILLTNLPIILIKMFKGDIDVSYYSAAFNIITILNMIPSLINASFYPFLSSRSNKIGETKKIISFYFLILLILSLFLILFINLFSKEVIYIMYGNNFERAVFSLKILSYSLPFSFFCGFFGIILSSINKQKLAMKILFYVLLLSLFLYITLTLQASLETYSYIYLFIQSVMFIVELVFIKRIVFSKKKLCLLS